MAEPLPDSELAALRGLGEPLDPAQVREVYAPLAELVAERARACSRPYVLGIAGSVAVGKSTAARVLHALLTRDGLAVALVPTDGFLLPNAELEARGAMTRKGWPESYDRRALYAFVDAVRAGSTATAPVYSHLVYDVVPGAGVTVERPDVLIVEGLNVLQAGRARDDGSVEPAVGDLFDLSIYLDADPADIARWYVTRFLALRATAFADPSSYFRRFADLDDAGATRTGEQVWHEINEPNLREHIAPTRARASIVLHKGPDHRITWVEWQ